VALVENVKLRHYRNLNKVAVETVFFNKLLGLLEGISPLTLFLSLCAMAANSATKHIVIRPHCDSHLLAMHSATSLSPAHLSQI
jgi:hypothetical protein